MTDFEEIEKQVTKNDNTIINNAAPVVSINYDGDSSVEKIFEDIK